MSPRVLNWRKLSQLPSNESVGNALINARPETLENRNKFREAFKHRWCLDQGVQNVRCPLRD
jgi:putative SOS response-associated peptidase YedK